MTVTINGERFKTYSEDTRETVIQRYAYHKKTLPRYIKFSIDFGPKTKEPIQATFLSDIVSNIELTDILERKDDIRRLEREWSVDEEELSMYWMYIASGKKATAISTVIKYKLPEETLRRLNKKYADFLVEITVKERELKETVLAFDKYNTTLKGIVKPKYDDFNVERITKRLTVKLPNLGFTLMNIFDSVETSESIPFVFLRYQKKTYYKVFENYVEPSWLDDFSEKTEEEEDRIVFKVLKSSVRKRLYDSILWTQNDELEGQRSFSIVYNRSAFGTEGVLSGGEGTEGEGEEDIVKNTLLTSISKNGIDVTIEKDEDISVKGYYYVHLSQQTVNRYIFLDMIMNDAYISSLLMVKERSTSRKGRQVQEMASAKKRFFIYYWPKSIDTFENTFTFTIAQEDDQLLVRLFRIANLRQAEEFQNTFAKILGVYFSKYNEVFEYYNNYIPKFQEKLARLDKNTRKTKKGKTKVLLNRLREKRPDMFIKKYSSICDPMRQPWIVSEKEAEKYDDSMKMLFPKPPNAEWYVCSPRENPNKFKYPGLVKNEKLDNKDEFPYLPCCYKENQKRKGKYLEWLKGAKIPTRRSSGTGRPKGSIMLTNTYGYAKLPVNVIELLRNVFGDSTEEDILRFGVPKNGNSFLHCLEEAFNIEYSGLPYEQSVEHVNKLRRTFVKLPLQIAKQEMFSYSIKEIRERILDDSKSFDPRLFIRLAEHRYKCNVFMFYFTKQTGFSLSELKEAIDGEILIPYYSQTYLQPRLPTRKSVIVVMSPDGHYDIVGNIVKNQQNRYVFKDENVVNYLIDTFNRSLNVYQLFSLNPLNLYKPPKFSFVKEATGQYIDDNGKVRLLQFDNLTLETSPLPPFNLPLITDISQNIVYAKYNSVLQFIKTYNFKVLGMIPGRGVIIRNDRLAFGFIFTKPPASATFPMMPSYYRDPLQTENYSLIDTYRYNKRVANYLINRTLYVYSVNPKEFSKESFTIVSATRDISNSRYDLSDTSLSMNDSTFMRGGKIVVEKDTIANRLMYQLELAKKNIPEALKEYKNRKFIVESFDSMYDFTKHRNETVFLNRESLIRWLSTRSILENYNVNNVEDSEDTWPYFYKNFRVFEDSIVLLQNVKNGELNRALNVSGVWQTYGYNPGYYSVSPKNITRISYYEYSCCDKKLVKGKTKSEANVFRYEDGTYAAVLFL